jgi:hypothetical protein
MCCPARSSRCPGADSGASGPCTCQRIPASRWQQAPERRGAGRPSHQSPVLTPSHRLDTPSSAPTDRYQRPAGTCRTHQQAARMTESFPTSIRIPFNAVQLGAPHIERWHQCYYAGMPHRRPGRASSGRGAPLVSNAPKADGGPAAQWANSGLMQRSMRCVPLRLCRLWPQPSACRNG